MAKIKKGDTVVVIAGEDVGQRGLVQRVLPKARQVVVAGVNVVIKHQKAVQAGRSQAKAGRIEFEAPIDLSNVMLVCPRCDQPTRVGFVVNDNGEKARTCKKCQAEVA